MEHLHDYQVINEDINGRMEVCRECHKRITVKKDPRTQRVDNKKYIKEHQRDTLQPHGRTGKQFDRYYGKEAGVINRYK